MNKKEIFLSLLLALSLAFFVSPLASPSPDGLEKVAADKGFIEKEETRPAFLSPVPSYSWPGIDNDTLATGFAGIFGTVLVFGIACGVALIIKR